MGRKRAPNTRTRAKNRQKPTNALYANRRTSPELFIRNVFRRSVRKSSERWTALRINSSEHVRLLAYSAFVGSVYFSHAFARLKRVFTTFASNLVVDNYGTLVWLGVCNAPAIEARPAKERYCIGLDSLNMFNQVRSNTTYSFFISLLKRKNIYVLSTMLSRRKKDHASETRGT